jgi:uncharacterized lipoprotein YddW (UPF0748 family)
MSRGLRAASPAAVLIASICLAWEPLPPGGASAFSQAADSAWLTPPYLERLRQSTEILPSDELRALWVVRDALTSPAAIDRLVDFAVQTRFHLLFVQVRGRGDAYYRTRLDPVAPGIAGSIADFDPLAYLITLAHRQGIAVHAWLNVFYVWSDPTSAPPASHLAARHPEWILSNARGVRMDHVPRSRRKAEGIDGQFLSPGVQGLRTHMANVVKDLIASYDIDGIHLDYIRYPNREYSFDTESRARFTVRYGIDPAELVAGDRAALQRMLGAQALASMDSAYSEFRVAQVDSMVSAIHAAAGGRAVSAAVIADPVVARIDKGQEWARWVHQGWVDFVAPMAYTMPPAEIEHRARVYLRTVGVDHVLVGLGVYGGHDDDLAETVSLLREIGVAGYAIFSYNALVENVDGAALIENAVLPPDTLGAGDEEEEDDEDDESP